jgi:hypothetical protein
VLQIKNLGQVLAGIDEWIDACEALAEGAFRGMVVESFKFILEGTPEWSGNLVANWSLTIGTPADSYDPDLFKESRRELALGEPYSRLTPNYDAIHYAESVAAQSLPLVRLGADVFITNNTPYAVQVALNEREDDGRPFLRSVNLPVEMVHAAAERGAVEYNNITTAKALQLAGAQL